MDSNGSSFIDWSAFVGIMIPGIIVWFIILKVRQARVQRIHRTYGRTEVAERIIRREVWVGMTAIQLRDSLGVPVAIDEEVRRTTHKEVWKYARTGVNRYNLRIVIEDGEVTGWQEKNTK